MNISFLQSTPLLRLTALIGLFSALSFQAKSQAPLINCPAAPVLYQDSASNDPLFWGAIYDPQSPNSPHDLPERSALVQISATNTCPNSTLTFLYTLELDLNNDGTRETQINSNSLPPAGMVPAWNLANGLGENEAFDSRPVPAAQKWRFGIKISPPNGSQPQTAQIIWNNTLAEETLPLLPQGNHQVTWFVNSSCNEQSTCTFPLTIQSPAYLDTLPPVVNCINGLSINQMNGPTNTVTLWASDFLVNATDNITPGNLIRYGVRKSGLGSGFPMVNGAAQTSVTFNCNELGTNLVELWAMDEAGNSDFCETYVLVQDNTGGCEGTPTGFFGRITTEQQEGVEDVSIILSPSSAGFPITSFSLFSNQNGDFWVMNAIPFPPSFEIKPELDADQLNGVNTWDLVLVSRHILNVQPLNTPYKLIAADANKSGTVTTFDIVELRKLLLGTYTYLPNNTSWRFVDKYQQFTNNENPFADVLRESVSFLNTGWGLNMSFDFVGIKIGDLDNSATPNNLLAPDDRNAPFTAFHITRNDAKHWLVNKGDAVELTFSSPHTLSGYQMTLETDGIQPSEVVPGEGMSNDNFGVFDHAVTTVFEQGNTPFSIRFTAEENGDLRDMIHVSSRITPAMAFGQNGEKMQVNLRFEGEKSSISPNPWSEHTRISYYTPEPTTATLKVFDMAGRLVYFTANNAEKGEQSFELNADQVPVTGILLYEITTDNGVISGKMNKH